jgi:transcriptional antiterminator/mannitol/fructose-specific phosphotransferase system IIA component (Ntr-type)
MDNDVLILMQFLFKKKYLTLKDIEMGINVTRRQATYRIDKLNVILKSEKVPLITVNPDAAKGISIDVKTAEAITRFLSNSSIEEKYYLGKKERLIYMYLMLFLNMDYLSLNHFTASLGVSRSTVLLDFKELVRFLDGEGIQVENNRSKGYFLVGSEMLIRRIMMKYVNSALTEDNNRKVFEIFIDEYNLDNFNNSLVIIKELSKQHHIRFVENRLVEFIYVFVFLKARMQSGKSAADEIEQLIDTNVMLSMKEYEFTLDLLKNYKDTEKITGADINYISSWILGISFGDINEDTKDCILISELVGKIMTRFESLSGAHYQNSEEIFIRLYSHFRPAYYRLIFKLPIYNPIREEVKEEFRELYPLVEETMKPFNVIFGGEIPEDEIAYLTMHFATIYTSDKKVSEVRKQKTALVVCSNGIGTASILYNELTEMFPELHFLSPMESVRLDEFPEHVDIIFATNYVSHMIKTDVPVIRVAPIMSISERYRVMREVYMQIGSKSLKQPNVDVVMSIVSKYADIKSENVLYNELLTYFSQVEIEQNDHGKKLHLIDMVRPSIIRLGIEADNWEEAIRKAYEAMVDNGFITQNYVDETVRSVNIVGPYIVITKHVALSHTKPQEGALIPALGIGVLKNAVAFGSESNDPVKYIFSLSATDNESHLCAMAELVELLNDDKFYDMLNKAQDADEVMQFLNNLKEK